MTKPPFLQEQPDFSLVLGGPLYQLLLRAHLSGDTLQLLHRRILSIACVAWLPLLLLSLISGHALGGVRVPFLYDVEAHVRFLIALPILIAAELIVHLRIRPIVAQFIKRRIIHPDEIPKFHKAIDTTMRLRNSVVTEVVLLLLVYTVGLWIWDTRVALDTPTWYATPDGATKHLTLAGYWYVFVSVPIFQFIFLRWYLRFIFWFVFLLKVARLRLHLVPTHPDRCGGLSFLGGSTRAFAPILFAQGAMLAGLIASQIFYAGQNLLDFKVEVLAFIAFFVAVIVSPLVVFAPQLAQAKRDGMNEYGQLASRYVREFEHKWVHGRGAAPDDPLLGSGDVQSLADLVNSYAVVQEMRVVPFGMKDAIRLAMAAAVPLLPLMLTIFSLEQLLTQVLKIVF